MYHPWNYIQILVTFYEEENEATIYWKTILNIHIELKCIINQTENVSLTVIFSGRFSHLGIEIFPNFPTVHNALCISTTSVAFSFLVANFVALYSHSLKFYRVNFPFACYWVLSFIDVSPSHPFLASDPFFFPSLCFFPPSIDWISKGNNRVRPPQYCAYLVIIFMNIPFSLDF